MLHELLENAKTEIGSVQSAREVIAQNLLSCAEIATQQVLPNPAETSQIATGRTYSLRVLDSIMESRTGQDTDISKILKTSNNFVFLRSAYALYLFGADPDSRKVIRILSQAKDDLERRQCEEPDRDRGLYFHILNRLSVSQRQRQSFDDADTTLVRLLTECGDDFRVWRIRAITGQLTNEGARSPFWRIEGALPAVHLQAFVRPAQILARLNDLFRVAGSLTGIRRLPSHAQYYFVKATFRLGKCHPAEWASFIHDHTADFSGPSWAAYNAGIARTVALPTANEDECAKAFLSDIAESLVRTYQGKCDEYDEEGYEFSDAMDPNGPCFMVMENYRFCVSLLRLARAHFVPATNACRATLIQEARSGFTVLRERRDRLEDFVAALSDRMPSGFRATLFNEILERQAALEEYFPELRLADSAIGIDI
jgi:hypothetical protein